MLQEIQTPRLRLRALQNEDWPAISFLRSDGEVNRFVQRASAETQSKALEFIRHIKSGTESRALYYWAISLADHAEMIGSVCLWNFSTHRKEAEIGYDLHPDFHGRGIMSEALQAVIPFGSENLGLSRILAFTQKDNLPSIHLLSKNGFVLLPDRIDPDQQKNAVYKRDLIDPGM